MITVIVSVSYFSYAFFTNKSEQHGKINIVAGKLNYKMRINGEDVGDSYDLYVPDSSGAILDVEIQNLSNFSTKYQLYYFADPEPTYMNVEYDNTSDQPFGIINANGKKHMKIIIENLGQECINVTLELISGFIYNELESDDHGYEIVARTTQVQTLADSIINNNQILSLSSVDDPVVNGLYSSNDTDSGQPTYFFRGNGYNNYVFFASRTWRIVRINENGTIRIALDNSIDSTKYSFNSTNSNFDYSNSNIKNVLDNWFDLSIANDENNLKLIADLNSSYFCDDSDVAEIAAFTEDSETYYMTVAEDYTPSFTCNNTLQGLGQINANIGLLTYDELIFSGFMSGHTGLNSKNFKSYLSHTFNYWTMTPAGVTESGANSFVWQAIANNLNLTSNQVATTARLVPVVNLRADAKAFLDDGGWYLLYYE